MPGVTNTWERTVDVHRDSVRSAVIDAAAVVVSEQGVLGATMAAVAAQAGIGRATLYRYFSSIEDVIEAWHAYQVSEHVQAVRAVAETTETTDRLRCVLEAYATFSRHGPKHATVLHTSEAVTAGQRQIQLLLCSILADEVQRGAVREDVPVKELSSFCLSALAPTVQLHSKAAVGRAIQLTLQAIRTELPYS